MPFIASLFQLPAQTCLNQKFLSQTDVNKKKQRHFYLIPYICNTFGF